jgi:hypothetical protein
MIALFFILLNQSVGSIVFQFHFNAPVQGFAFRGFVISDRPAGAIPFRGKPGSIDTL